MHARTKTSSVRNNNKKRNHCNTGIKLLTSFEGGSIHQESWS